MPNSHDTRPIWGDYCKKINITAQAKSPRRIQSVNRPVFSGGSLVDAAVIGKTREKRNRGTDSTPGHRLDDEVLDLDMEIEATKREAVSAGALSASLRTFGDLYQEAVL